MASHGVIQVMFGICYTYYELTVWLAADVTAKYISSGTCVVISIKVFYHHNHAAFA